MYRNILLLHGRHGATNTSRNSERLLGVRATAGKTIFVFKAENEMFWGFLSGLEMLIMYIHVSSAVKAYLRDVFI